MPSPKRAAAPRTPVRPRKASRRKPTSLAIKQSPPPREADPFAKKTGARRSYFTPEFLAEAKRRVEQTSQSTTAIAADLGMHHSVLSRLVKREGWVRPEGSLRRRGLSPVMRLAAAADALARAALASPPPERGRSDCEAVRVGVSDASPEQSTPIPTLPLSGGGSPTALAASAIASAAPPPPDTSTIDRLEAAVLKELSVVETMRASLGAEPLRPMDAERTARTLSTLTETLAKLRRLRLGAQPQAGSIDHDDDIPDIDEFRRDLARRIRLFVASRTGGRSADGDRVVAVETPRS
jgi:hypothetical protein